MEITKVEEEIINEQRNFNITKIRKGMVLLKNSNDVLLKACLAIILLMGGIFVSPGSSWAETSQGPVTYVQVESRLDAILQRGYIRVGTTGDYKPFSYVNPVTGQYEGHDIDIAKQLANDLGVKVVFVKSSWPTLMEDLLADKFDIAMGGITRTLERAKKAQFSHPYLEFGKSPLIRIVDKDKFKSLADIDQPSVKIGVNPGGTNEKFVRANIKKAQIVVFEKNLEIPGKVAGGEVDVMVTDSIEAKLYAKVDQRLYAPLTDQPFTRSQMGYLMPRGDFIFSSWINFWMEEIRLRGDLQKITKQWLEQ